MGGLVDFIFGSDDAEKAAYQASNVTADAYTEAAEIGAASQTEALDYLKQTEEVPQHFRREAIRKLGGMAGIGGLAGADAGYGYQDEMIQSLIDSPLYKSIIGGQEAGEEAIMRNASATGGLRSGNIQDAFYDYNTQLQNQALLQSYNQQIQGLTGLAGLPSNANAVAQTMGGIGQTQAQGVLGAGQARSQGLIAGTQAGAVGNQQTMNNLLGIAGTIAMFSDRQLKTNIIKIDKINGYNFYSFDWNSVANKLGLKGSTFGCMADEIFNIVPEAVFFKDGFMMVNYSIIGVL